MIETLEFNFIGQQWAVGSYGFFMALAALAVFFISMRILVKRKLPFPQSVLCLSVMAISVPIGARMLNVAINPGYYSRYPEKICVIESTGFSIMGGLLLAVITGVIVGRLLKLPIWRLGDAVAPGLGIGIALMKAGCYLNGCCYGIRTSLPWAVRFPYGSLPHRHYLSETDTGGFFSLGKLLSSPAIHPTQLYELTGGLLAAALAMILYKKRAPEGVPGLAALMLYMLFRLICHFLRVQPATNSVPYLFYPVVYMIVLSISAVLLAYRWKKTTM